MILRSKRKLLPPDNQVEKYDEPNVESKNEPEADKEDTKKGRSWKWREGLEPDPLIAHSIRSKGPQRFVRSSLEDLGEDLSIGQQGIFRSPPKDLNTGSKGVLRFGADGLLRFPLEDLGEDLSIGHDQGMRPKK